VALIAFATSKADALSQCRKLNPRSQLLMPKTEDRQEKFEEYVEAKNISSGNFYLGMARVENHWFWDDGTPVFVQCKFELQGANLELTTK